MQILIACQDKDKLKCFKQKIEGDGYEVIGVSSKETLGNLLNAGYRIDAIISEYWLGNFYGHDITAKVGFCTPTLIWGAKRQLLNAVLGAVSFPKTTFIRGVVDIKNISHYVAELVAVVTSENV